MTLEEFIAGLLFQACVESELDYDNLWLPHSEAIIRLRDLHTVAPWGLPEVFRFGVTRPR